MKRLVLAVAVAASLLAAPVMAQSATPDTPPPSVDVSGLSPAQIAQINADIEAQRAASPVSKAAEVNEWVNIGAGIGSGLAAAARETGQVVNEFAATPVGQLTVAVILFKVMGGDLIQLFIGLLFFGVSIIGWSVCFNRIFATKTVTTIDPTTKVKTIVRDPGDFNDTRQVSMVLMFLAAIALTIVGSLITFL